MAGALEFLLLDLLLNEVLCGGDGGAVAADGYNAVARARRESALLRDLDVGARHLLDFHQASSAGTCMDDIGMLYHCALLREVVFLGTLAY